MLVLVTPELVGAMNPGEVPPCVPGSSSTSPTDCQLYLKGHIEVPACYPACNGRGCAECNQSGFAPASSPSEPGMIVDPADRMTPPEQIAPPRGTSPPAGPQAPATHPQGGTSAGISRSAPPSAVSVSQNRAIPSRPQIRSGTNPPPAAGEMPGFLGPVGYDTNR
jgi:pilus assembly protein CpaC